MNLNLSKIKNFLFPKPKIKAIVFDYGGVIETSDFDLFKKIADYLGADKKEFNKIYLTFNHLYNVEGKEMKDVLSLVAEKFNATSEQIANIHKLCEESERSWKVNEKILFLIKKIKKNYKVGVLSNFSSKLRDIMKDQGTINLFDVIVISNEVGYQKPQPGIFQILFNKLGVKSNEVVFIDDAKSSLFGAEEIGYIPILFTSNEELEKTLNKLGVKIS